MLNDTMKLDAQTEDDTDEYNAGPDQTVSVLLNLSQEHNRVAMALAFLDDPSAFFERAKCVECFDHDDSGIHVAIARPERKDAEFWLTVRFFGFESNDLREHLITAALDPATYFDMCSFKGFSAETDGHVCIRFDPPAEAIR